MVGQSTHANNLLPRPYIYPTRIYTSCGCVYTPIMQWPIFTFSVNQHCVLEKMIRVTAYRSEGPFDTATFVA